MLAGMSLSSVFADVLDKDIMRTIRLINIFRNQLIYSEDTLER
jgi:hypothetical protein